MLKGRVSNKEIKRNAIDVIVIQVQRNRRQGNLVSLACFPENPIMLLITRLLINN